MRNKLVFEGKEKAYKWGKYNIGRGTHYNWKKYNTNTRNKYNWKEYAINEVGAKEYFWNEYKTSYQTGYYTFAEIPHNGNQVKGYRWNKYAKTGQVTKVKYVWNKYKTYWVGYDYSKTFPEDNDNPYQFALTDYEIDYPLVLDKPNLMRAQSSSYAATIPLNDMNKLILGSTSYSYGSNPSEWHLTISGYTEEHVSLNTSIGYIYHDNSTPTLQKTVIVSKEDLSNGQYHPDKFDFYINVTEKLVLFVKGEYLEDGELKTFYTEITKPFGKYYLLPNDYTITPLTIYCNSTKGLESWAKMTLTTKTAKIGYVPIGETNIPITNPAEIGYFNGGQLIGIKLYDKITIPSTINEWTDRSKDGVYFFSKLTLLSADLSQVAYVDFSEIEEVVYSDTSDAYSNNVFIREDITNADGTTTSTIGYYIRQGTTTVMEDTWDKDSDPTEIFFSWDSNANYPADGTIDGDYKWTKTAIGWLTRYYTAELIDELEFKPQLSNDIPTETSPLVLRWDTPDKINQLQYYFYGYDIKGQVNWESTHTIYATDMTSAIVQELATKKAYFQMLSQNRFLSGMGTSMYQFTEFSTYSNGKFTNVIKRTVNNVAPTTDADKYYGEYLGAQAQNDEYLQIYGATGKFKSDLIGQVVSVNRSAYPDNGIQNNKWYEFVKEEDSTVKKRGDYIQNITSYEINGYPEDGIKDGKWYVYQDYDIERYQGSYIETVSSGSATAYPQNGYSAPYWYVYDGSAEDTYKGSFVDYVINTSYSAFPQEGTQDDYWYSYIGETANDIYTITETELAGGVDYTHDINNASDFVIGTAASAQIKFSIKEDVRSAQKYEGLTARWYNQQGSSSEWKQMGRFIITDVNAQDQMTSTLLGYDFISKFDIYVDDWLDGLTFPMTIGNFYKGLCEKVGVDYKTLTFINSGYYFEDNFTSNNITARQLLQYIAQCASAYATVDENGVADLRQYLSKDVSLDKTKYTKLNYAYYTITPIGKLTVQMSNNDLGVSAGTGDNIYKITNNPIFYFESEEQALQPVQNVFNIIKQVVYTPCDIDLLEDYGIDCGDIITVDGMTAYIMSKTISASGVKLKCMGNKVREVTGEETNSSINALRGKSNELVRTIEETQSKLVDTANKLESKITQTASSLETKITDGDNGLQSQITQTASELTSKITDTKSELETEITQKTDSISATVTSQGELIAQLRLDVDGINLTGYVTFNDLKNSGSTIINGDNITTGTINADRINMTGAISWGDLSSSCQSTIEGMSGGGASVPSYIKSTYIDSTMIMSPTIYGGIITAGTDDDGYLQMAATGMQYYASGGSILCDIGYQANAKNLPYILLGQGKDSVGTGRGMIKKYTNGLWIGDNEGVLGSTPTGTGIFINFNTNKVYKYISGTATAL